MEGIKPNQVGWDVEVTKMTLEYNKIWTMEVKILIMSELYRIIGTQQIIHFKFTIN
jgi:hypothetical protein